MLFFKIYSRQEACNLPENRAQSKDLDLEIFSNSYVQSSGLNLHTDLEYGHQSNCILYQNFVPESTIFKGPLFTSSGKPGIHTSATCKEACAFASNTCFSEASPPLTADALSSIRSASSWSTFL